MYIIHFSVVIITTENLLNGNYGSVFIHVAYRQMISQNSSIPINIPVHSPLSSKPCVISCPITTPMPP